MIEVMGGKDLDDIGALYGVVRKIEPDAEFRARIASKILGTNPLARRDDIVIGAKVRVPMTIGGERRDFDGIVTKMDHRRDGGTDFTVDIDGWSAFIEARFAHTIRKLS